MATTTQPPSSSSSVTRQEPDTEAQQTKTPRVSTFGLVFNPSGVNDDVLNHKYPGQGTEESPFIVDFLPQDGHNPMQFPAWRKWTIVLLTATATLAVAFVSTAFSGGISEVIKDFHVSTEVSILGISLFVCGFAVGPLLWAPLSGE
jgi:Ca2+/H+ antiporter